MLCRGIRLSGPWLLLAVSIVATGCERMYFREAAVPPASPRHALQAWPYREYWTGVVFNGEKIGLTHLALFPVEGTRTYELRSEALLAFHFLGLNKQVTLRAQDWVTDDLRLERFAYDYDLDGNKLKLTGTVQAGQLVVERETAGQFTRDAIPLTEALYPTSAIALYPSLHGLGAGRQHRYRVYDGQRQEVATVSQTIGPYQESDLYDGRAYRIETELGGQHSTLWINDRAEPVLERAWGGLLFSTLESERQAKGYLARASVNKRDVLVEFSRVRANMSLPDPRAVTRMQVMLQELPDAFAVPSDPWQRCAREPDGIRCSIRKADMPGTATGAAEPGAGLESYLQPTVTVDSADSRAQATARAIVTDALDPLARIDRLVHWIQQNVDQAPVDVFSSSDVLQGRKAECQGLTWLYAAFARSLGIPTRVVNGLVYSKELDGFLYHTWAESYVGTGWLPVDPTFGQVGVDATHIKLIEGDRLADLLPLTDIVGKIRLQILSVEPT
ncbi:MAG: transglutaminase domain-containing protein [Nitrospirae bacterium]|nr:transglutaminase domain-containing protein [Nitrospirota bacterium]